VTCHGISLTSGHSIHLRAYKHLMEPSLNSQLSQSDEAPHTVKRDSIAQTLYTPGWRHWHYRTASYTNSLNIPGQVGHTHKAHTVTPWCTSHQQQQKQLSRSIVWAASVVPSREAYKTVKCGSCTFSRTRASVVLRTDSRCSLCKYLMRN